MIDQIDASLTQGGIRVSIDSAGSTTALPIETLCNTPPFPKQKGSREWHRGVQCCGDGAQLETLHDTALFLQMTVAAFKRRCVTGRSR